jgi:hypothetical protein
MSAVSPTASPIELLKKIIQEEYRHSFEIYNDRFLSFPTLYRAVQKRFLFSIEQFYEALFALEEEKFFFLGGYTHLEDVKEKAYAYFHPDRGYLYWIFQPEPPQFLKESPVIDL